MNEQINKQAKSNNPLEAAITPSTSVRGTWPLARTIMHNLDKLSRITLKIK